MSARAKLRSETRGAHETLDAHFSRYDLSDEADYRAFLVAHAAAFIPVEQALTRAGAARLFDRWPDMRRAHWLEQDLAAMGVALPSPVSPPTFADDAAICGGVYVLEGSRLGGAVLRRTIAPTLPTGFLSHDPSPRWPEIVTKIERILVDDVDRTRAVVAANAAFACFLRALPADESGGNERDD